MIPWVMNRDSRGSKVHLQVLRCLGLALVCVWPMIASADICSAYGRLPEVEASRLAIGLVEEGSMDRLLGKLESMDVCAVLPQVDGQLNLEFADHRRLHAAILAVAAVGRGRAVTSAEAISVASTLAQEFHFRSDQEALLAYLARRLAGKPDTEPLMALTEGSFSGHSEAAIAASAVATVAAGEWGPPGDQPIRLYIGNEAHDGIGRYYRRTNRRHEVRLNEVPISGLIIGFARRGIGPRKNLRAKATGNLALRPDITNLDTLEVYEIKPAGLEVEAAAQVQLYIAAFASAGVTVVAGRPDAPGTVGVVPAPAGHFRFHAPRAGVISYQYRRGDYLPVPAGEREPRTASVDARVESGQRSRALVQPRPIRIQKTLVEDYWDHMAATTGLSGFGLLVYVVLSEGSRAFPPRNAIPVP